MSSSKKPQDSVISLLENRSASIDDLMQGIHAQRDGCNASPSSMDQPFVDGSVLTVTGAVPRVSTVLTAGDKTSTIKVRLGFSRMRYTVHPGLYAFGNPSPDSLVFVTANFKLSFDCLRRNLHGRSGWILVLDTKGINVWCAAGKGTFGTEELINRIRAVQLERIMSPKKLILPQLSAPGVSAHEIKKRTGFRVIYGPVRAADILRFLDNRLQAAPEMRRVKFGLSDRLILIPVELTGTLKWAVLVFLGFILISGFGGGGYSIARLLTEGIRSAEILAAGYLGGLVLTPLLLPWLPGRAFALKGLFAGMLAIFGFLMLNGIGKLQLGSYLLHASLILTGLAVSSFLAMNFTGSSTYTSLSGVVKEMRIALPLQVCAALCGVSVWIISRFFTG